MQLFAKTLFIASAFVMASAASANLDLANAKTCTACHSVDSKVLGPAFKEIAAKYAGQADAVDHLVTSITTGSQGRWGPVPMPANPVSKEEATTLANWILSLK